MRKFGDLRDWLMCRQRWMRYPTATSFVFGSDFSSEIVEIERAVGFADIDRRMTTPFFFESAPRCDIGVMIQRGTTISSPAVS